MPSEAALARWKPKGVDALEPAADEVVRSVANVLVVAGPGAGKTELLAQRACFLLQTGLCPSPRRILAISMKRDAARNLRERVASRCGRELGARFDSYTFDSFSKGFIDRFGAGMPLAFRPTHDYTVLDSKAFNERTALDAVKSIPSRTLGLTTSQVYGINSKSLWQALIGRPLSIDGSWINRSDTESAAAALWQHLLKSGTQSAVAFPMLGRMAELLLRANPLLLKGLQSAYRFVFLDEFQDTSAIHYHLVKRAFQGTEAVVTAVGDNKQTIMRWAGAMPNIFDHYEKDFGATRKPLVRNYRSTQHLVDVQAVVAQAVDRNATRAVSMVPEAEGTGEFRVLAFQDDEHEAQYLAALIKKWIEEEGLNPHDICVLCRMRAASYAAQLQVALTTAGVASRIEVDMQDLLAEPLAETLLDFLKLAVTSSAPESWTRSLELLKNLQGDDSESAMRQVADSLLEFADSLAEAIQSSATDATSIATVFEAVLEFIGVKDFQGYHPQYLREDWYRKVMADLAAALAKELRETSWTQAIGSLEGHQSVPIMTTHKSKGLEYHTIVFVGLEDSAHFKFSENEIEETCGFFVAMSRAERRVVFTFAGIRPTGRRGERVMQGRSELKPLYDLLEGAGIAPEVIEAGTVP